MQLIDGVEFVNRFFGENQNIFVYILAPFHQGFNETAALTSRVVDYGIVNSFTTTPLLWADFDNLIGVSDTSAAQYFGDRIGRAQSGGLTPGLVGGVLLDFRSSYILWFFGLGFVSALLLYCARFNKKYLCVLVIFLSQLVHLFHRGFLKPEYFTIMLIAVVYLATLRGQKIERPA